MENTNCEKKEVSNQEEIFNDNEEKIEDCPELYPMDEDDATMENDACDDENDGKEAKSVPIWNYVVMALMAIILALNMLITYDLKKQLDDTQEVLNHRWNGIYGEKEFFGYEDMDFSAEADRIRERKDSYRKYMEERQKQLEELGAADTETSPAESE